MNKKIFGIGLTILVLGALVFSVGGSVFAQADTPEAAVAELPEPAVTREGRGFGPGDGTCDGTCDGTHDVDGDGLPDQLRLQDGTGTGMQYGQAFGPADGSGFGPANGEGQGFAAGEGQGFGRGNKQAAGQQGAGMRDGSCIGD